MSITKDFESRSSYEDRGNEVYWPEDVHALLAHTRALEAMLKKHEFGGYGESGPGNCPECDGNDFVNPWHESDCPLAKLLEGVGQ